MRKLMILGAGVYQLPLIKKAKEVGLYVIVVSPKGNYPGIPYADQMYYVDTTSENEVLEIAKVEKINGICTTSTDVALKSLGKVVDSMGLKGPSYYSALLSTDKYKMKKVFEKYGVRTAKYIKVFKKEEAIQAFEILNKPVIFKAVDSSGSRGIIKVENETDIDYAYKKVMQVTKLNYFIIEEYLEGVEFGAQAFLLNGKLQFVLAHGDIVFNKGDTGVPIGHYIPYNISDKVIQNMKLQLSKAIEALKLDNCAINADFILKNDDVYVLEIGARAGATCLPELVSIYYGFDYYEQIINIALNQKADFTPKTKQPCAGELIISETDGIITSIDFSKVNKNPNISDISFDYKIGDRINQFKVGPDRIGQIIVKGDSVSSALTLLEQIKQNITINLQ